MAKRSILDDPRYPEFVERYHADPLRFAVEACGMEPSYDQERLFRSLQEPDAKVSVVSGTGCFAKGTLMMRANGEPVAVEDVRVGDRLMGPDGASVRNVLELRRGREPMYRFTYMDGTSHVFNESHILCLAPGAKYISRGKTESITVTVREWLAWPKTRQQRYYAYRSPVVEFEREPESLPVPPYQVGLWLGDGTVRKPAITTPDVEVRDAWIEFIRDCGALPSMSVNSVSRDGVTCHQVAAARVVGAEQGNPVAERLRAAGVFENKHIPDAYLYASLEDRLQLLAGLIDTGGHLDKNSGGYDWIQKDERLAKQFWWLARSVGCHATIKRCRKGCQTGAVGTYWRVHVGKNVSRIPVRVARKRVEPREDGVRDKLIYGIKRVEPLGEGDYYGFVLDGDSRFLGHDFTVLHNTGKTASFGRIALWHLLCHPVAVYEGKVEVGSNTYIGAPRIAQVADGVWKEMQDVRLALLNGPHAWICDYFDITKTRVTVKGFEDQWFISQIALQQGQSVGVAGKHRYWQLIIIDEAAGVPDDHFNVINGTQTQGGNRTLLASQGVRNAGFFYDTHHALAKKNGGSWVSLRFSSERSPFVDKQWLDDRLRETGGRQSVEYQIRVLGRFAEDSSRMLLSRAEVESAFQPRTIIRDDEPYGLMVLGDVAMGEYRDESVAIVAKVIGYSDHGPDARRVEYMEIPICTNSKNEIDFAGDLVNLYGRLSNATLLVDNGGVGATVNKLIERSGVPVVKVDWGKPCFKKEYKDRFYNLRACAMVRFRDAVRQGRVVLPQGLSQSLRAKILDQGSRLPYHFAEAGGLRYVMESKEAMRKEGIKSPDIIDAMSFAFLEGAQYIVAEGYTPEGVDARKQSAREAALDALADIE